MTQAKKTNRAPREPRPSAALVTLKQGEMVSGIPARTLRDLVVRGALPVVRLPGLRRDWLRRTDLDALIASSVERIA